MHNSTMNRNWRRAAAVAWASFLVASALELAVFAFVDPANLHTLSGEKLDLSATAIYSLSFLVFWCVAAGASLLTLLLDGSAKELNALPLSNG